MTITGVHHLKFPAKLVANQVRMASSNTNVPSSKPFEDLTSQTPGEHFEPRQTLDHDDQKPDPSKSLPLSPARQALIDDVIALYSCQPTIERVNRYTKDCVYDDQFVYANNRYKMAGQCEGNMEQGLPKFFKDSTNIGYEIVRNDKLLIQFKNEQSWTFKLIPKTAVINALVSLSLDPDTAESDFPQIKYHKDQANSKDYSHRGFGFYFKKFQADHVAELMSAPEVEHFKADQGSELKDDVKQYESGESHKQV